MRNTKRKCCQTNCFSGVVKDLQQVYLHSAKTFVQNEMSKDFGNDTVRQDLTKQMVQTCIAQHVVLEHGTVLFF